MPLGYMRYTNAGPKAILLLVLSGVGASEGQSQRSRLEPSAAEVAVSLRTKGHAGAARTVLTQALRPKSPQELDEIADTLAAIAATFPGNDARGSATRMEALLSLSFAGQGDNGIVGVAHAVPYGGAAARLMRIAQTAQDVGIRAAALATLKSQPDRAKSLSFLQQVAKSQNEMAWVAVQILGNETGSEGRAIAQQLFRDGSVTEAYAKSTLDNMAHAYGWR